MINFFVSFSSQNELQSTDKEETAAQNILDIRIHNESVGEEPVLFNTLAKDLDEKQKASLREQYDEQGSRFFQT